MYSTDVIKIFDLLTRSNKNGLKISMDKEELSIKFSRGKKIDADLLQEIKSNKANLIHYFKNETNDPTSNDPEEENLLSNRIEYQGQYYYHITPVQLYWVNDDKDKEFKQEDEIHGSALSVCDIHGEFEPEILRKAVAYVVRRHESLRSTFHRVDGEYLMRIENENSLGWGLEWMDLSSAQISEAELGKLARYHGHKFNFQKGPLFITRLIKTESKKYILAIKLHHIIMDNWSSEILLRDLLVAYNDYSVNKEPRLPVLNYQLKECLAFINNDAKKNYHRDRTYWKTLYPSLPDELIIPGAKKIDEKKLSERVCRIISFEVPDELPGRLNFLSKQFSTSIFIILQATLKAFLHHQTGQSDITLGTYVFGREYPGSEDQIGCYAKTVLIRTIFNSTDSFHEIIEQIKKANKDMQTYKAYTLMDAMEDMLPDKREICGSFWKINLQYNDSHQAYIKNNNSIEGLLEKSPIQMIPWPRSGNSVIPIDMQLNFNREGKKLKLVAHYDSSGYDLPAISNFFDSYLAYSMKVLN